jgi:hypothetical protein
VGETPNADSLARNQDGQATRSKISTEVSLVVSFVGSSNCSRIDKAYDKAYDKVSFFMQSKQYWARRPLSLRRGLTPGKSYRYRAIVVHPKMTMRGEFKNVVLWCQTPCLHWEPVLALCACAGSVCALPEEPGAVIPHAGICERGTG